MARPAPTSQRRDLPAVGPGASKEPREVAAVAGRMVALAEVFFLARGWLAGGATDSCRGSSSSEFLPALEVDSFGAAPMKLVERFDIDKLSAGPGCEGKRSHS
jgi:hypothetical protein